MKSLIFVAALSVLSASVAFAQGVQYDPYATNPPLPHSPNVGVSDYPSAPQQFRHYYIRHRVTPRARQKGAQ